MVPSYPLLILLVEDVPGRVDLFRRALKQRHDLSNVLAVKDGLEARDCLVHQGRFALVTPPDAVLISVDPLRADARRLLRTVQRSRPLRGLLTVVLSPVGSREAVDALTQRGASIVLPQSQDLEGFCEVVDRIQAAWKTQAPGVPGRAERPPTRPGAVLSP